MVVFAPYPLGETRVQREAEALVKRGYQVDVICVCLPGEIAQGHHKGVQIFREHYRFLSRLAKRGSLIEKFLKYIGFFITAAWRLSKLHLHKPYGSVQVHNLPDFLVFCAILPKLMGVPVILDLHDLMPEFYAGRFRQNKPGVLGFFRWQERMACRFADHVITVSDHWREALIGRGVPEAKCSVVMNVADESIFHPGQVSDAQHPQINGFRLIYHGSLHARYGLDQAIQAVDQVRGEIPGIHLTIVGQGEHLPRLVELVDELGLKQHVTLDGLHLAEELPGIIRSCHLGVVPYQNDVFTDGLLPTKLMEYAAVGIPAIASRTTAIQAYFADTMVEFFEPGNVDDLARCIRALSSHPERLAELTLGCQRFNQRYNWTSISAEYVGLVERLRANREGLPVGDMPPDLKDDRSWKTTGN
jgi:glycosyltransferase involved in cell wall biosynthesis